MNKLIQNEIYPFQVLVSIGESDQEFLNLLEIHEISDVSNDVVTLEKYEPGEGRTELINNCQIIIRLNFNPSSPEDLSIVPHEVLHAVGFICNELNIPFNDDTEEVYAYLLEFYTKEIFKLIEKENTTCEDIRSQHG